MLLIVATTSRQSGFISTFSMLLKIEEVIWAAKKQLPLLLALYFVITILWPFCRQVTHVTTQDIKNKSSPVSEPSVIKF